MTFLKARILLLINCWKKLVKQRVKKMIYRIKFCLRSKRLKRITWILTLKRWSIRDSGKRGWIVRRK